ncbi:MAG: hypothetical protein C4329_07275 [Chitinophagaceae bacterium]
MVNGAFLAIFVQNKIMDTTTKIILLFLMYGLPICAAFIYKLRCNIKEKKQLHSPIHLHNNT